MFNTFENEEEVRSTIASKVCDRDSGDCGDLVNHEGHVDASAWAHHDGGLLHNNESIQNIQVPQIDKYLL